MYKKKKFFMLGMARSGYEAAKVLLGRGHEVLITDVKDQDENHVLELKELGAVYEQIDKPEEILDRNYDFVVKNPGIHYENKCVLKAKELGIPVINEMEMIYNILPKDVFIIGITGSNGKTTTTMITYEILKHAGLSVHYGGNIGIPVAAIFKQIKEKDILVLEVSSHQLVDLKYFKPNISILTNLSETHLDFFGNYKNYLKNKAKIFENQKDSDYAIINRDNAESMKITKKIAPKKIYFSTENKGDIIIKDDAIFYNDEEIIKLREIRVKGNHNIQNIMCAIIVAKKFGVDNTYIKEVLNKFSGVEHRIEFVRKVNEREFYNDSKSTNVVSTNVALTAFNNSLILLLGGLDRGHSFDDLKPNLNHVKYIIAYGETKDRIKQFADSVNINCIVVNTLEDAVKVSYNFSDPGDTILLSPACASWDQFKDFEVRGNFFKQYVDNIE